MWMHYCRLFLIFLSSLPIFGNMDMPCKMSRRRERNWEENRMFVLDSVVCLYVKLRHPCMLHWLVDITNRFRIGCAEHYHDFQINVNYANHLRFHNIYSLHVQKMQCARCVCTKEVFRWFSLGFILAIRVFFETFTVFLLRAYHPYRVLFVFYFFHSMISVGDECMSYSDLLCLLIRAHHSQTSNSIVLVPHY